MKYNQYSFSTIKKLINIGQTAAKEGKSEYEVCDLIEEPSEAEFIYLGYQNPDYEIGEIREYYRIGEPREDGHGSYLPSYNFAEDRPEDGVSVVTTAWLNSYKSVFFNTTDEKIASRGIYKIKGFALPGVGGDDETMICPMDWAVKTDIRTRDDLEKAVMEAEGCK